MIAFLLLNRVTIKVINSESLGNEKLFLNHFLCIENGKEGELK